MNKWQCGRHHNNDYCVNEDVTYVIIYVVRRKHVLMFPKNSKKSLRSVFSLLVIVSVWVWLINESKYCPTLEKYSVIFEAKWKYVYHYMIMNKKLSPVEYKINTCRWVLFLNYNKKHRSETRCLVKYNPRKFD